MATKKKKSTKGPVRVSALKTAKKAAPKKAVASAKSAYKFVTDNVAGTSLKKIQRMAEGVISDVQKRVSDALSGDGKGQELAKLRKEWITKRLSRTKLAKALPKRKR